ncbi:MAG: hypothetical protein GY859_08235 [Desulfobacterales bacterium]|nr:hypothetical protein [Desulfobacterales bacterium]
MDKKTLMSFVDSPEFIPGIFNYCDRWCERCAFTARCMNFALGEQEIEDPESRDIDNKAFWEKLNETFQATFELLLELAERRGVKLDSIDVEDAKEREKFIRKNADADPCAIAAKKYMEMANEWFDAAEELFKKRADQEYMHIQSDIPTPVVVIPDDEEDDLKDMVEVIRWCKPQIYVKIMRALRGLQNEFTEFEIPDEFPKDSDGSAKVALIDIDRSMAAWTKMGHYLPEMEIGVIKILVHLDGLRNIVEKTFPDARAFVRPGFDDVGQSPIIGNA